MRAISCYSPTTIIAAFLLSLAGTVAGQTSQSLYELALNGSSGYISTSLLFTNPQSFTETVWFNTTSSQGGRLVGFGSSQTGQSTNYDRHLYMDGLGHILFGLYGSTFEVISNQTACNDGNWHQAAATFSNGAGMVLYIDGLPVATNVLATDEVYNGWWRIGYDDLNGWPNAPSSYYFNGTVGEVQIWNTALTAANIQMNLHLFRSGNEPGLVSYWQFNEGGGTITYDTTTNGNTGTLHGGINWVYSIEPIGLPQVYYEASSTETVSTVILAGGVVGNNQQTGAWFEYGTITNYGLNSAVMTIAASAVDGVALEQNIAGLAPGTLYHYRLVATNSAGTNFGGDQTFATLTVAQTVFPVTLPATEIGGTSMKLNGAVKPEGIPASAWFQYGLTTGYGNATPPANLGAATQLSPVTARISGLTGGELYHYRLVVSNSSGILIGADHVAEGTLIGLYGDNPLTNCLGMPFSDPGYVAAPASPMAIAAGDNSALAAKGDGSVVAWGSDTEGETNVPTALGAVLSVAEGDDFCLALQANGSVAAWGEHNEGQADVPVRMTNLIAVSAGKEFGMALTEAGTVLAWGDDSFGECDIPTTLSNVVAVAAGDYFGLALQSDGAVTGWGRNPDGGKTGPFFALNGGASAIAAGTGFWLVLMSDGTVTGDGFSDDDELPLPAGLTNVVAISVGGDFCMALQSNGTIIGWGSPPSGEPGGWNITENEPHIVSQSALEIQPMTVGVNSDVLVGVAAGNTFSLGVDAGGGVQGGGENSDGDLDIPSDLNVSSNAISVTGSVNVNVPGVYTLTYTLTNFLGAVDTVTRTVVVPAPPPPKNFAIVPGNDPGGASGVSLQFNGDPNASYTVLATTNIALPLSEWQSIGSATLVSGHLFQFSDTAGLTGRFYMVRSP